MILSCILLAALQSSVTSAPLPDRYADALRKYAAGDIDGARASLAAIPEGTVRTARGEIERGLDRRRGFDVAEAAAMLHTELVIDAAGLTLTMPAEVHLATAKRLVDALWEWDAGARRAFVRDWYLLMTAFFQREDNFDAARDITAQARARFRDDAEVQLASGAVRERQARLGSGRFPSRDDPRGYIHIDPREELRSAASYYRRALELSPRHESSAETRLRLGRVTHVLGDPRAAERELEVAIAAATDEVIRYLALVFLAAVKEDLARKGDAFTLYAEAAGLRPDGQVVFIGLAELYFADGQPAEAAKMTNRLFAPEDPIDPWWTYQQGQAWRLSTRLDRLRQGVRPR